MTVSYHASMEWCIYCWKCDSTMKKRTVRGRQLTNQSLYEVIEDFYRLGHDINEERSESMNNYSIIRLVTIMEQFCRCVIEERFENQTEQIPQKIEIEHDLLDDLLETVLSTADGDVKNAIISMSYSFQNVHAICEEMRNFGLLDRQNKLKSKIMKLEPLFQMRHVLVHTVEPWPVSTETIASYHAKVEEVIKGILETLDVPMYDFYVLKGHAFVGMVRRTCLANVPCIGRMDEFSSMADADPNDKSAWIKNAKKFHDISVECSNTALEGLIAKSKDRLKRIDVLDELAWTHEIRNDHKKSEKFADAALQLDPADSIACYCKGMSMLARNEPDALAYFKKSVNGDGYVSEAYTQTIELLVEDYEIEDALSYADRAIEEDPSDPILYMLKAKVLNQLGLTRYEKECYEAGDKRSVEFVKNRRHDILMCDELIGGLREHGKAETVKKCLQILEARFGHIYVFKEE